MHVQKRARQQLRHQRESAVVIRCRDEDRLNLCGAQVEARGWGGLARAPVRRLSDQPIRHAQRLQRVSMQRQELQCRLVAPKRVLPATSGRLDDAPVGAPGRPSAWARALTCWTECGHTERPFSTKAALRCSLYAQPCQQPWFKQEDVLCGPPAANHSPYIRASSFAVRYDAPRVPLALHQPGALLQAHRHLGEVQVQRQRCILANKAAEALAHTLKAAGQAHFRWCRPPWPCSPGLVKYDHHDVIW